MNIILNLMDSIYGDSKMLTIIYGVGAGLLFIFILLLIFSLRKPDGKSKNIDKKQEKEEIKEETETKEEETKTDDVVDIKNEEDKKEDVVDEKVVSDEINENNIFEKTTIIPINDISTDPDPMTKEETVEKALDNADNMEPTYEEEKEEVNTDKISSEIPDVDDFVDNVVKKTYEKNEQFSSVYVGDNTDTMKLDKIMENADIDDDVKVALTPNSNNEEKENKEEETNENIESDAEYVEEVKESASDLVTNPETDINNLKTALEEKNKETVEVKNEDNKKEAMNAEDLLNKLNALKKNNK